MAFKIVQTIENRVPKLTVVPTLWETNGIVRWPPKNIKYASKLIKDRDSRPGPEWDSFECVLKRNYIPTYEEANKELSQMEQNTDTDYDNDNYSFQQMSRIDQANKHLIDFEVMAQNLDNLRSCANASTASTINVCDQQQDTIHVYSSQEIQTVINNQNLILKSLETFVKVQKQLVSKMADFSVQLEETKTSITQEKDRPVNVTLVQDALNTEENESFCMTPIENQQQLEILETNLADKTYKKKYAKTLSLLCSSSVGSGTRCAYKLLDVIFSRDFLCTCSWSGGSKGEVSKIPLKNFKNIRRFFFEMINSWDSNYTDDDAESFLKLVLRNATKRKTMKGLRESAKRTRKNRNPREQSHGDESNSDIGLHNINEPQVGDNNNSNIREELQAKQNQERPETRDNREPSDEELDLC